MPEADEYPVTAIHYPEPLGESVAFLDFQARLSDVAPIERPVLIIGERGTGKELAARRLHYLSSRWDGPLVALNCGALAPALLESELFGHEAGAFTGAVRRRAGRFELADGGTLFLDELGNMPSEVQAKLLRVIEYGEFERVGGSQPVRVDVRLVGATNADLPAMVAKGDFKPDLLDRLSFEVLTLPPLRAREGDIELLAHYFAAAMAQELGRGDVPVFIDQVMADMLAYGWPGNIRELKNVVERAVARSDEPQIASVDFTPFDSDWQSSPKAKAATQPADDDRESGRAEPLAYKERVRQLELESLHEALNATRHHQRKAADYLGLTYDQFRGLYRKHQQNLS